MQRWEYMAEHSPDEWIARARSGDRAALRVVAEQWWPTMRRWALLDLGDASLAEDAAQEAMVRLVRFIHQYDSDRPFRAWLHAVVRNCARDVMARRGRQGERELALEWEVADHPSTERQLDLQRHAATAMKAFETLSARQRQVFDLCDRQGLTPAEAAETLGMAQGTARYTLHEARKALRAKLLAAGSDVLQLLRDR